MIIQMCGLSGSGKSTLANGLATYAAQNGIALEVLDGDVYRQSICAGLGFSRPDRETNIRRLGFVAHLLSKHNIIAVMAVINPFEAVRHEIAQTYPGVYTVFVSCPLKTLMARDTKGLYRRAMLSPGHPDRVPNLSGVNDLFEVPQNPDLVLETGRYDQETCLEELIAFVLAKRNIVQPATLCAL